MKLAVSPDSDFYFDTDISSMIRQIVSLNPAKSRRNSSRNKYDYFAKQTIALNETNNVPKLRTRNLAKLYTFNRTNTTIVPMPSSVSSYRICLRFLKMAITASKKFSLLPEMPSSDLNWEDAMLIAAAEVNPVITGSDIKSSKKPFKTARS